MIDYIDVAHALVDAGYLSDADLDAAAVILADTLIVQEAEEMEAAALIDKAEQIETILDAELIADAAVAAGSAEVETAAQEVIDDAFASVVEDKAIIHEAETVMEVAYADAVAALVAAEMIDEADAKAAAAVITKAWVVEED